MKLNGLSSIMLQRTTEGISVTSSSSEEKNYALAARKIKASNSTSSDKKIKANGPSAGMTWIAPNNTVKMLDGFLPDLDTKRNQNNVQIYEMYEDIYLHDAICGGAVDFMSTLPFGGFACTTAEQKNGEIYEKCLKKLRIREMLPLLVADYLVYGTYVGSLNFNKELKYYDFLATHNIKDCDIEYPPVENMDPIITVRISCDWAKSNNDKYDVWKKKIPAYLQKNADIVLSPMSTLYAARNTSATQLRGVSLFDRVLMVCLFEKYLMRGTVARAARRLSPITHVKVGSENHVPTDGELQAVADMFSNLDADPVEAIVATRDDVDVTDVKNGTDFWKWDDIFEISTAAKYRALGLSEDLLNGNTTIANMEANMSFLLSKEKKLRESIQEQILDKSIFENIAIVNGMTVAKDGTYINGKLYDIPEVTWEDSLSASDDKKLEMLDKLAEKGVPVPLRMYAAAGNVDIDKIVETLEEDKKLREELGMQGQGFDDGMSDEDAYDMSGDDALSDVDDVLDEADDALSASATVTASENKQYEKKKRGLLSRILNRNYKTEANARYYGLHDRDTAGKRRYENGARQKELELQANRQIVKSINELKK